MDTGNTLSRAGSGLRQTLYQTGRATHPKDVSESLAKAVLPDCIAVSHCSLGCGVIGEHTRMPAPARIGYAALSALSVKGRVA
jgi:hypothetical protein